MRTRQIKPGTLKYLNSAIEFFKKKRGLNSIACKIKFERHRDTIVGKRYFKRMRTLGHYDPATNEIVIFGCEYHPRNQLVKTLFHELTHYWQYKIAKKLRYVVEFGNQQVDSLFSDQSLIKDYYHAHPLTRHLFYNNKDTSDTFYWFKPHEIEARAEADILFMEWNVPEYKGKV